MTCLCLSLCLSCLGLVRILRSVRWYLFSDLEILLLYFFRYFLCFCLLFFTVSILTYPSEPHTHRMLFSFLPLSGLCGIIPTHLSLNWLIVSMFSHLNTSLFLILDVPTLILFWFTVFCWRKHLSQDSSVQGISGLTVSSGSPDSSSSFFVSIRLFDCLVDTVCKELKNNSNLCNSNIFSVWVESA